MINNKNASIFIFILILINVILILWYVVFNNVTVMNNNIDIWKNAEEVFKNVIQKWEINIQTDLQYNNNWNSFEDFISCPTNVKMTWDWTNAAWLLTEMHYLYWSTFCLWNYNWDEFRIFFDKDTHDFNKAYYKSDIVNLIEDDPYTKWSNIAPWSSVDATPRYDSNHDVSYAYDGIVNNKYYRSNQVKNAYIEFDLWSEKNLYNLYFYKKTHSYYKWWNNAKVYYYDWSHTAIAYSDLTWKRWEADFWIDLRAYWSTHWIRYIKIFTTSNNSRRLDFKEIKIYEWLMWWAWRKGERKFNDSDSTLISFWTEGTTWWDDLDDNFNSDDYRVSSTWTVMYPWDFQDDDVIPRLTVFWDVRDSKVYQNIFWTNYKTNDFIEGNNYNNDWLNVKIWDVSEGYFYLDLFSDSPNINFDIKVYEFDRNAYKNEYTLLLKKSYEKKWMLKNSWYLEFDGTNLDLSTEKTANIMKFDFKNKDYALFLINNLDSNLSYRLTWEDNAWKKIYINAIDDSSIWYIKSLSNHMIIWDEKNFIWEQFIVVWSKF